MKDLAVINDNHAGTQRCAGTTVQSAKALRLYAVDEIKGLLAAIDTDLVVNGDLFDSYQVPLSDAHAVLEAFSQWLSRGHRLTLLPGNHDLSNDSSKMSTFEFISRILAVNPNVTYLQGSGWVNDSTYAISHVPNQDLFDLELSRVPECKYLLLHCNWDNGFAKESDHSLNLAKEVAEKLPVERIVLGHEHSAGEHLGGKVVIAGNQFPMSISDCLDKQDKVFVTLTDDGIKRTRSWERMNYVEVDWREASTANAKFIRVVGNADETEAAEAVEAVSRLRRVSEAFIVGSAVRFSSGDEIDMTEALASVEDVRAFDVMAALKDILKPEQIKVLESLT